MKHENGFAKAGGGTGISAMRSIQRLAARSATVQQKSGLPSMFMPTTAISRALTAIYTARALRIDTSLLAPVAPGD
ncbi:hypothetical protein WME98_40765 [Sorangium sp. So ce296]|uniref:hypothetical protein n=1 Tax=Sorangium sp. So ce296 TaxID=3133296 RepID=UPI003F642AF9